MPAARRAPRRAAAGRARAGNVHSDESVACVLDADTWAQVAILACRVEPATFADYVAEVAGYYNAADMLVERNNHGHLVIRELARAGCGCWTATTGDRGGCRM